MVDSDSELREAVNLFPECLPLPGGYNTTSDNSDKCREMGILYTINDE